MSGPTQPTWSVILNGTTTDGMITWTCMGAPPDSGDCIYDADTCPPRIFPMPGQTWPTVLYVPNAVQIHFVAGYGNSGSSMPATLRKLMRLLISDGYYNRDLQIPGSISQEPGVSTE